MKLHRNSLLAAISCIAMFGLSACTRPEQAENVLAQSGYTEIEITGWRPFAAGEGDTFSTGFRAKAPNGQIVTGTVTSGILKGATVRFD